MNRASWQSVLGKEGFAEVFSAFRPRLLRFFESLGADARSAEDLCQELFLKLLRTEARYEERGQMHAYLFRMAHHLWIDHSRIRRPLLVAEPSEEDFARLREPESSPLTSCEDKEAKERLRTALLTLPAPQRAAFEMGVIQGMRYRDIAEVLGIPLGTVKTRIFAASAKIREILTEPAPEKISSRRRI